MAHTERDDRGTVEPALLDIETLHHMGLGSTRHIRRLTDSGRMPAPVRLGALLRWRRADIEQWIAAGCPSCRQARGGAR